MVLRPHVLRPQFERYAERGHRVVAVDLRGHGQSDNPEGSYAMGVFADDVAWVCERIGLEKPVVIGHSMGDIVSPPATRRCPRQS